MPLLERTTNCLVVLKLWSGWCWCYRCVWVGWHLELAAAVTFAVAIATIEVTWLVALAVVAIAIRLTLTQQTVTEGWALQVAGGKTDAKCSTECQG